MSSGRKRLCRRRPPSPPRAFPAGSAYTRNRQVDSVVDATPAGGATYNKTVAGCDPRLCAHEMDMAKARTRGTVEAELEHARILWEQKFEVVQSAWVAKARQDVRMCLESNGGTQCAKVSVAAEADLLIVLYTVKSERDL